MLFHTQIFLIFFSLVFGAFHLAGSRESKRNILLIASIIFYMCWSIPLVSLLILSSVIDFYAGKKLWEGGRKWWLYASLFFNLGVLIFFKYANFLVGSFYGVLGSLGFDASHASLNIILPLGISFYTFQSMSYTLDMHRKKYKPYDSILDFTLYVMFFPQLVAGPIVRANDFRKQLSRKMRVRWPCFYQGINSFSIGVFKKVVIADQAAVFVNAVYSSPTEYTVLLTLVAVLSFSFQIYFDFSAYTDMARGLGYFLGIRLPENFNHPYGALGVRDFWRKWHISLSTWLKDYLYIPLGGNRKGRNRTYISLMVTMILGGLWHGASWNFVIWGGIHGALLSMENYFSKKYSLESKSLIINVIVASMTFAVITLSWIFFRAPTFGVAMEIFGSLLEIHIDDLFGQVGFFKIQNWILGFFLPLSIIIISYFKPFDKTFKSYGIVISIIIVLGMICITSVVSGGSNEFIYFQF